MNGIQNGYKGIGVEIISYTKHPAKIIWDMLKQTWISLHDAEYDPNDETVKEFIIDSLSKRLNPVPQETILIQAMLKQAELETVLTIQVIFWVKDYLVQVLIVVLLGIVLL